MAQRDKHLPRKVLAMSGKHSEDTGKAKGILTDVTKCIGCERCVEACTRQNKLPSEIEARFQKGDGLSGYRYTSIVRMAKTGATVRRQCLHCIDPACQTACLVHAFTKTADGAVVYDAKKCIGCRYCMLACPFGIPRYEWNELLPYVSKCKMNEDCRVDGGMPACVSACPTGATIFGVRDDLIKEAKARIKSKPKLYEDHIYGEKEFGGTSVMYITSKDSPLWDALHMASPKEMEKRAVGMLKEESIPKMVTPWVWVTPIQFGAVFTSLWIVWLWRRKNEIQGGGHHPDRGSGSAPDPNTAAFDEVCPADLSETPGDKEAE